MTDIPVDPTMWQGSSWWPPAGPSTAPPAPPRPPPPAPCPESAPDAGPTAGPGAAQGARKKSCAACRLRRVKCERPLGQDECYKCLERGLRCVPYERPDKAQFRNGKRVRAAKHLYGDANMTSPASTPGSVSTRCPALSGSGTLTYESAVSYPSADVRLGTIELKETILSNLLDSFFTYRSIAVFDGDVDFKKNFDLAGRRVEQLDDSNQVLCAVILALGARCSDSPALLGSSGPSLLTLRDATVNDTDLRVYGALRARAYDTLVQQALELADAKGAFRKASPENVAALILLEGMLGLPGDAGGVTATFSSHYAAQVRELLTRAQVDRDLARAMQGTALAWTAFIRDAYSAAWSGHPPIFSEDDFWLLRGEEAEPLPIAEQLREPAGDNPERDFWTLLQSISHHAAYLGRDVAATLTGVRAKRRATIDEAAVARSLHAVQVGMNAMPELLRRTAALQAPVKFRSDAATLVRGMRLSLCNFSFLLLRILHERLQLRPSGHIAELDASCAPAGSPDPAYWERLTRLERLATRAAFKAGREIVATVRDALDQGIPLGTHEWLDVRGAQLLFGRLPLWARILVDRPTEEEGGWPGYPLRDKVEDLRTIARALRSIGWASATLAAPLDWINAELARNEAQLAFLAHSPPSPPPLLGGLDPASLFGTVGPDLASLLLDQLESPTIATTLGAFFPLSSSSSTPASSFGTESGTGGSTPSGAFPPLSSDPGLQSFFDETNSGLSTAAAATAALPSEGLSAAAGLPALDPLSAFLAGGDSVIWGGAEHDTPVSNPAAAESVPAAASTTTATIDEGPGIQGRLGPRQR